MNVIAKRAIAFIIDLVFAAVIIAIIGEIFNIKGFYVYTYGVPIALLRDIIIGGRSLGKIIIGLKVVDLKTNEKASVLKLIVRNVGLLIWYVDAIIILCDNSSSRLMDRALNLNVVSVRNNGNLLK